MPPPKLYELKLHESPVLDDGKNYERFSLDWFLEIEVDVDDESDPKSSSKIILEPGDVIYIPELATGAGEFEVMRFVGQKMTEKNQDKLLLPLLKSSVEYPEFPPEIQELYPNLREPYESIFDTMLSRMVGGPDTLKDITGGGDAELDEYWSNPPIRRPRKGKKQQREHQHWIIPLKLCQIAKVS